MLLFLTTSLCTKPDSRLCVTALQLWGTCGQISLYAYQERCLVMLTLHHLILLQQNGRELVAGWDRRTPAGIYCLLCSSTKFLSRYKVTSVAAVWSLPATATAINHRKHKIPIEPYHKAMSEVQNPQTPTMPYRRKPSAATVLSISITLGFFFLDPLLPQVHQAAHS